MQVPSGAGAFLWPMVEMQRKWGGHDQLDGQEVKASMVTQAFENVQGQMGYCGIWCGSCIIGNGALRELTKKYERLMRAYGLYHWGPEELDFGRLIEGLEAIQRIPLCPGCLRGGGREGCALRNCAVQNGLASCNQCRAMAACEHIELLQHMRSGALQARLFVNTEDVDREQLMARWAADLQAQWPCCILFGHGQ